MTWIIKVNIDIKFVLLPYVNVGAQLFAYSVVETWIAEAVFANIAMLPGP